MKFESLLKDTGQAETKKKKKKKQKRSKVITKECSFRFLFFFLYAVHTKKGEEEEMKCGWHRVE